MKKLLTLISIFALIIAFTVPAMAGNPGYINDKGKCVGGSYCIGNDGEIIDGPSTITNKNKNTAIGVGVGVGIGVGIGGQGGQGGNATIEKGAIQNKVNNNNTNMQGQSQDQAQVQGQSQTAKGGNAVNAGNKQSTTVTVEGDKYEASKMHIEGPALMKSDAKLSDGEPFAGKYQGSVMNKLTSITYKQARYLSKDSADVEVMKALLGENDFRTDNISIGDTSGEFMGYIYVNATGSDVNAVGMEGKALEAAMYAGMTGIERAFKGPGKVASGKSWNVGLGGGASIITSGDSVAVAPNGGLGVGRAKASNELLPNMVFKVYFNKAKAWMQKSDSYKSQHSMSYSGGYSSGGGR